MSSKKAFSFAKMINFEELFTRSWWVILFILICFLCYEQGLKKRDEDFAKLSKQYSELQKEKAAASALQESLLRQVNSQSDPEWVELVLMKGLGLVPEGQTKVLFTDQKGVLEK